MILATSTIQSNSFDNHFLGEDGSLANQALILSSNHATNAKSTIGNTYSGPIIGPIRLQKRKAAALGEDPLNMTNIFNPVGGLNVMGTSDPEMKIRRTMSRCAKSYRKLTDLSSSLFSEPAINMDELDVAALSPFADPLFCLGTDFSSQECPCVLKVSASVLFPRLPTAISESSCSTKTLLSVTNPTTCTNGADKTSSSDVSASTKEDTNESVNNSKSYGWFVVLDEEEEGRFDTRVSSAKNVYASGSSSENLTLAFVAPTAPKGSSAEEEAELAYAQAADTVDDIFGGLDF